MSLPDTKRKEILGRISTRRNVSTAETAARHTVKELTRPVKGHPHQAFLDEADTAMSGEGRGMAGGDALSGPNHVANHNSHQMRGAPEDRHKDDMRVARKLSKIASKHGFVQDPKAKHMFHHPASGATLNVHKPNQEFYTDKYAGVWLSTPRSAFPPKKPKAMA